MDRRVKGIADVDDDGDGDSWEECDLDGGKMGFLMVDDDIAVRVGQDDQNFRGLMPGESWTTSVSFQNNQYDELSNYIPDSSDDVVPGDRFRFRFTGVVVDWWYWGGTMEEHADTIFKLPSFIAGKVTDPADNGGRPQLVVPVSEAVQFIYTV